RCGATVRRRREAIPTPAQNEPKDGNPTSHAAEPVVDVLLHLVLGIAVAGLDLALELLAVAVDLGDVVVGELAPLFLHLAGDLLPIAFDAIPIHRQFLSWMFLKEVCL